MKLMEEGAYAIDGDAFRQFSSKSGQRTDVRLIAEHSLSEQATAHAATWLDRQAFGGRPDPPIVDHAEVQEAMRQRQEWLGQQGYAERTADGEVALRRMRSRSLRPKNTLWPASASPKSTASRSLSFPRAGPSKAVTAASNRSMAANKRSSSPKTRSFSRQSSALPSLLQAVRSV